MEMIFMKLIQMSFQLECRAINPKLTLILIYSLKQLYFRTARMDQTRGLAELQDAPDEMLDGVVVGDSRLDKH